MASIKLFILQLNWSSNAVPLGLASTTLELSDIRRELPRDGDSFLTQSFVLRKLCCR
jgi:hypothetical protein